MPLPDRYSTLLDTAVYPGRPAAVELIETHGAWVLLAGEWVYKIKKPVNLGFLDYSTLDRRREVCEAEVRLNRRLAPDVYLGVTRICEDQGRISLDGPGEVVDYAVTMRRLPAGRMLNRLLPDDVSADEIAEVAAQLAAFHATLPADPDLARLGRSDQIARQVIRNLEGCKPFIGETISRDDWRALSAWTRDQLRRLRPLFRQRLKQGWIREGHGDLHAANVCMTEPPTIYDCIEFSQPFRTLDVVNEVAFLAMDLEAHHRPDLAAALVRGYVNKSGAELPDDLLRFYQTYRAAVRGKVKSIEASQAAGSRPDRAASALREARHYLGLATAYARGLYAPLVVLLTGLPGSGKSTVARALAPAIPARLLSTDVIRREVSAETSAERYSDGARLAVYERLAERALEELGDFRSVILDAGFRTAAQRQAVLDRLSRLPHRLVVLECTAPREALLERLRERQLRGDDPSEAGPTTLTIAEAETEPWATGTPLVRWETDAPVDAATLRAALLESSALGR